MLPKAPRFPTTQNQPNQPFSPAGQKEARPELLWIRQESGLQMPGLARAPIISAGAEKAEKSLPRTEKRRFLSPLERQGPAPGTAALPLGTTRAPLTAPACASQNPGHAGIPHSSAPARNPGTRAETHPPSRQVGRGPQETLPNPHSQPPSRTRRRNTITQASRSPYHNQLEAPPQACLLRTPFKDHPWAGCRKEGAFTPGGPVGPFVQPRWTTGSRACPKEPWNHRRTQHYPSRP